VFALQLGIPAGPELLILLLIVALVVPFALAYYVYRDATGRGTDSPGLWAAAVGGFTFLFLPLGVAVFGYYVLKRP
jgi:hypothetical protein